MDDCLWDYSGTGARLSNRFAGLVTISRFPGATQAAAQVVAGYQTTKPWKKSATPGDFSTFIGPAEDAALEAELQEATREESVVAEKLFGLREDFCFDSFVL